MHTAWMYEPLPRKFHVFDAQSTFTVAHLEREKEYDGFCTFWSVELIDVPQKSLRSARSQNIARCREYHK